MDALTNTTPYVNENNVLLWEGAPQFLTGSYRHPGILPVEEGDVIPHWHPLPQQRSP